MSAIDTSTDTFTDAELVELYEQLLLPRTIEEKMLTLLRQGRLSKWFSGIGQEAIAVGVTHALRPRDWILPMHRNLGVWTARNVDLDRLLRQLLGRADGFTKGRDRTFHFGSLPDRIVGMISHLGATVPVADGLALAASLRGADDVAATFSGDGGTSEGDFHEAVNLAAVWRLPVLFVIENNGYGLSTPTSEQYACDDLASRGVGYGIHGEVVDGNDVIAVVQAVRTAAARARAGDGPTLLEFKTFRMRGHEEASGTDYVPGELFDEWAARDPIVRFEAVLDQRDVVAEPERVRLRDECRAMVDARIGAALGAPLPTSTVATELGDVYALPAEPLRRGRRAAKAERPDGDVRYLDAISAAMRTAMRADDSVVLLGQDIAEYGGAFKATAGFVAEFGRRRVRNTPIIESGAIGAALGLALDGFRPIVEMQFGDFISCGFNQIVNHLATTHYRWGGAVPVVIRAPIGGGMGAGPFHSQNVEGWFGHVPGLKIVAPATPADAYDLLLAAIDDPNPVLYLEHKLLYRSLAGPLRSDDAAPARIGEALVVRPGRDATVVTYSAGARWAIIAADRLAETDGLDVEVIDLRSLQPWDVATVVASVERTGRCLVVHEAPRSGGFGGEIAATVSELAFTSLDAPVTRLGALDTPIPFSKVLEEIHSPQALVVDAIRDLCAY